MSVFSKFGGVRATSSIVSAYTTASVAPVAYAGTNPGSAAKTLASGALTANTLKSMLSITGAGRLKYLSLYTADTTSRTLRVKVTVDGVAVVDVTSAATTTSGGGLIICGETSSGNLSQGPWAFANEIVFNASITVEIASSLSETDKLTMAYAYALE